MWFILFLDVHEYQNLHFLQLSDFFSSDRFYVTKKLMLLLVAPVFLWESLEYLASALLNSSTSRDSYSKSAILSLYT